MNPLTTFARAMFWQWGRDFAKWVERMVGGW
jgi:hypothetical protein